MKLSLKLFFGFGILLIVFISAVAVNWSHLSRVGEDSDYVSQTVVPAVDIATRYKSPPPNRI